MNPHSSEHGSLLRKTLMGKELFSILSGVTILFAQGWVLRILGLPENISLAILGIGLLVFAVTLVGIDEYHGVKVYLGLDIKQRLDVQLISNTNIISAATVCRRARAYTP